MAVVIVERPAAGYTSTTTTTNQGKYQTDSSLMNAISSVKVDGDINQLIDAVNDIASYDATGSYASLEVAVQQIKTNQDDIASLVSGSIPDGSITTVKLANDAVTNAKMADNAVDTLELVDGAVDNDKLADTSITSAKFQTDSVDNNAMGTNAVDSINIVSGAVDDTKLGVNSVTTTKILDGNVTTNKLEDDAVTVAKLNKDVSGNIDFEDTPISRFDAVIQTKTSDYTLTQADNGSVILMNSSSATSLTVPSGFGVGYNVTVVRYGTGTVDVLASSTTINSAGSNILIKDQYGAAVITSVGTDVFILNGSLEA